jgi:6-phosphogluconate dehydrogenase
MQIGMVGLGAMGRNLSLNMADHGCAVAGYDKDPGKVEALNQESEAQTIVNGALEATTSQHKSTA